MDVMDLKFEDKSFDIVIDKGTMDAIMVTSLAIAFNLQV